MTNERKIITFTFAAHYLFHFYELAFPALALSLAASLGLDLGGVLALAFPMYLLFGLFSLPWGILADRLGNRLAIIVFFLGTGAGALGTALSSTPTALMVWLGVVGFFASIYHPAGMAMISRGTLNRGTALGINGVAGSLGMATAPLLAGLLNWLAGWRWAYLAAALFALLWGAAMAMTPIDETEVKRADTGGEGGQGADMRRFVVLCLVATLGGLVYRINVVSLPPLIELKAGFLGRSLMEIPWLKAEGLSTMAAGLLVTLIYIVGMFGQLAGGALADRYRLVRLYLLFNLTCLPLVLMIRSVTEAPLVIAGAVYVFFALGIQPIENSLIAHFTPGRWRSTAYGITSVLIFGVGALAVPWVGKISRDWGLENVYLLSAALICLIVVGILFISGRDPYFFRKTGSRKSSS
ncbi:MAG TPA: MFS transporter [Syntrophales bacterium]|nr:MFS transporter [Syntrophales bacterium]